MNEFLAKEARFQERDLELANAWADEHEHKFDRAFLDSITAEFHSLGYLTDKQYKSLQKIIEGFNIEDWAEYNGIIVK